MEDDGGPEPAASPIPRLGVGGQTMGEGRGSGRKGRRLGKSEVMINWRTPGPLEDPGALRPQDPDIVMIIGRPQDPWGPQDARNPGPLQL